MTRRLVFALALLAAVRAAHAGTPADYAYTLPIERPEAAGSAWRIELTPAAYAWLQDAALRDLEVFNAAGQPVPVARIAARAAPRGREPDRALPVLALPASATTAASDLRLVIERDTEGRLHRIDAGEQAPGTAARTRDWLLDASGVGHAIDSLVLAWGTPTSGVVARFRVDASDDLQDWREAGSGTVLALAQDGARLERHDLALGGVRAKYLRLHRLDDGADLSDLRAQARLAERAADAAPRLWLDAAAAATQASAAPGVTRFDYMLPAALPVDAARIELATDNALAPLTLLAGVPDHGPTAWRELARATAFRLRVGDERIHNADIDLVPATRLRAFRLEAATPLAAPPRLTLGYRPDTFVFLAEGDAPYTLAVGSVRAHHADYPVEAALAGLRAKLGPDWQPPLASLGAARMSAGAVALEPLAPPTPWQRWLLWGVLVGGAAMVGGFALSLLRGSRGEPPPR